MTKYVNKNRQKEDDNTLQDQVHRIFQSWQNAAREWSALYCSLENETGGEKLKRMKQLEALESKINCIADQYEMARRAA